MTTYLHRCGDCGAALEAGTPSAERLACRTPGCAGRLERVPGVVLYPEPVAETPDHSRSA